MYTFDPDETVPQAAGPVPEPDRPEEDAREEQESPREQGVHDVMGEPSEVAPDVMGSQPPQPDETLGDQDDQSGRLGQPGEE